YLHPLRAPDGTIVTRGYPMENIPGERHDHPHHRGLGFTHGDVHGYDFWGNEFTQKPRSPKGIVGMTHIRHEAGKTAGTISGTFEWSKPGGEVLLTEEREMVFHAGSGNRLVGFDEGRHEQFRLLARLGQRLRFRGNPRDHFETGVHRLVHQRTLRIVLFRRHHRQQLSGRLPYGNRDRLTVSLHELVVHESMRYRNRRQAALGIDDPVSHLLRPSLLLVEPILPRCHRREPVSRRKRMLGHRFASRLLRRLHHVIADELPLGLERLTTHLLNELHADRFAFM
ncbi:MAG: PmoA family protein, partial [Planctomycetes bacterium]|nr:PmoA family protein [Planctomycetota bacterium]